MKTLKEFREATGKTQQQMADEFEISKSMYEKLENGSKKPGRELIKKIKRKYPIIDITIFLDLETTERVK